MNTISLESVVIELDNAFNRGDLGTVLDFYHPDAILVSEPGKVLRGIDQIRDFFSRILELGLLAKQHQTCTLTTSDTALYLARWELRSPHGRSSYKTATSVFKKTFQGEWKLIIDNAFGTEAINPGQSVLSHSVIIPPSQGTQLHVLGTEILLKIASNATHGSFSIITAMDSPGGGPPPHVHHQEDEVLIVLEGEYEFLLNGQSYRGGCGTIAILRRGETHTYRRVSPDQGRLMAFIIPGGFEDFFAGISRASEKGELSPDVITALAKDHQLEFRT
ncbi:MAG: cupin domain-containing protein [Candidatus Sumerlaeia bacterium]|nr:cupin domain-containing protein [Candidatus Sumerlaeia bacterium]